MREVQAFITAATASQPQRFVVGAGDDRDDAQASGAWVATDQPVEVRR